MLAMARMLPNGEYLDKDVYVIIKRQSQKVQSLILQTPHAKHYLGMLPEFGDVLRTNNMLSVPSCTHRTDVAATTAVSDESVDAVATTLGGGGAADAAGVDEEEAADDATQEMRSRWRNNYRGGAGGGAVAVCSGDATEALGNIGIIAAPPLRWTQVDDDGWLKLPDGRWMHPEYGTCPFKLNYSSDQRSRQTTRQWKKYYRDIAERDDKIREEMKQRYQPDGRWWLSR